MKGVRFLQFAPIRPTRLQDECKTDEFESPLHWLAPQNQGKTMEYEVLSEVMEERMKREECILSTSPHKKVVNAIRYAKAMNSSLESSLEKTLYMLHREFEQEFRRLLDVQRTACQEYPALQRYAHLVSSGVTNKQIRRRLSEALARKQRLEEFKRTRARLSLPTLTPAEPSSRQDNVYVPISRSKKDSEVVYLPPI